MEGGNFDGMEFGPFENACHEFFTAFGDGCGGDYGTTVAAVGVSTLAQPLLGVVRGLHHRMAGVQVMRA